MKEKENRSTRTRLEEDFGIDEIAAKILNAYLSGSLSNSDDEKILRWMSETGHRDALQKALKEEWDQHVQFNPIPGQWAYESYEEIARRLNFPEERRPVKVSFIPRRILIRIAAVLIPLSILGGLAYFGKDLLNRKEQVLLVETNEVPENIEEVAGVIAEMVTAPGAYDAITLEDGTYIMVNENTELRCREDGTVDISGEALFRVAKQQPDRPMVVRTKEMSVTVLGTEFDVDANAGDEISSISLYSGSVHVGIGEASYTLFPQTRLRYDKTTGKAEVTYMSQHLPGWVSSRLTFEQQPLSEVFKVLEWYYQVLIIIRPGVDTSQPYSFKMNGRENLADVLRMFKEVGGDFSYSIRDTAVYINN